MRIKKRKLPTLEEIFELDDDLLTGPDQVSWRSDLVGARRRETGERVLVKYWNKSGTPIDSDLRELWRREMRNADRIRVRPGADEVLVPAIETGEARDAFYLVMPGEWMPLHVKLRNAGNGHWLRNLQTPSNRQMLWSNISRVIKALDIIHAQRIVHGGLVTASIFTASDHEADFHVGGFEWCVKIGEAAPGPLQPMACSFQDDFRRLGRVLAELLGIPEQEPRRGDVVTRAQVLELSSNEQALALSLVTPAGDGHFDRRRLGLLMDAVEKEFAVAGWRDSGRYVLGVQFGLRSLEEAISRESDWLIPTHDRQGQLDFIHADLRAGGEIVRHGDGDIWALGEALAYRIGPAGPPNKPWSAAVTRHARPRDGLAYDRAEPQPLPTGALEFMAHGEVARRISTLGDRASDWSQLLSRGNTATPGDDIRLGFLLTEVALALYGVVEALPVVIVEHKEREVRISPAEDERLDSLRSALNVKSSLRRMQAIFELEDEDPEGEWVLRPSVTVTGRQNSWTTATFVEAEVEDGERYYRFHLTGPLPASDFMYLSKASDRNPHGVVHRRLRLLATLATQRELLQTLESPEATLGGGTRHDFDEDDDFQQLDPSKQNALRAISRKAPLQLVVGPPGVGKTHLLAQVVRRSLDEDAGRRILITAQGHQALDNAGKAVQEVLSRADGEDDHLLVRARTDRHTANRNLYATEHAVSYLSRATASRLARAAPQEYQHSLSAMLVAARQGTSQKTVHSHRPREVRALESVVMQAANVLLATANSGELSRLVDNAASFDEVIIEEAAKATGPELLAPMLLGMQRLMIGDHHQLPAFDSDRLIELLGDVERVRTALRDCDDLIGAAFRDHGLEELLEAARDEDRLARVCDRARAAVRLFETLVKRDEDRARTHSKAARVAVELTHQRRMHPAICDVVSRAFYHGRLASSDAAEAYFTQHPRPFLHTSEAMPASPLVWIDLPYMQVKNGAEECSPNFHNPAERDAVMAILKQVRATKGGKPPSLAVLSPYQRQAERLVRAIEDGKKGPLAHLASFVSAASTGTLAGTVDSFQGSEADLVIVSLVRNNGEHGGRALGFLRDARRMNVLLSRARWQLVLVGSREFFRAHARAYGKGRLSAPDVGCVQILMSIFDKLEEQSRATADRSFQMIPASDLLRRRG